MAIMSLKKGGNKSKKPKICVEHFGYLTSRLESSEVELNKQLLTYSHICMHIINANIAFS